MDSSSFDRLTRLVAAARSRRALGGALLGSVAGRLGLGGAEAAHCPRGKKHCGKRCIPVANCCTDANCCRSITGRVCRRGKCACPAGHKPCYGSCIPTASCCDNAQCPGANQLCQNRRCCSTPRGACTQPTDCCPGLQCSGSNTCCVAAGGTCQAPNDCCVGDCVGNLCVVQCETPANCPLPAQACAERTCVRGRCGVAPAPMSQLCRAARGDCDLNEFCDGASLDCPPDRFQSADSVCLVPVCDGGPGGTYIARPAVYCTGDGPTCPPRPEPAQNCGFYMCMSESGSVTCRTTCATDNDCIPSAHCLAPACVPD